MRRKTHPDQMSFGFPDPKPKYVPPEVQILNWMSSRSPLIHVGGGNPHICVVTTLRPGVEPVWVQRDWIGPELERYGYIRTHSLTSPDSHGSDITYDVYRPYGKPHESS